MMLTKRAFLAAAAALAMALPAGWAAARERLTVVATTGMIAAVSGIILGLCWLCAPERSRVGVGREDVVV